MRNICSVFTEDKKMRTLNPENLKTVEDYICDFIDRNGIPPTMDEISAGTGFPKTTVHRYVSALKCGGALDADGHRSIVLKKTNNKTVRVPVLGAVACGLPKFAEENIEEYVRLPSSIFGDGDFYILRAEGDSMKDAGIDSGDLVLIKHVTSAEPGNIVVALVGDEATLKRFYPEPRFKRIRLHPENRDFDDIYVDSCEIQGVAVKVLKDLA